VAKFQVRAFTAKLIFHVRAATRGCPRNQPGNLVDSL